MLAEIAEHVKIDAKGVSKSNEAVPLGFGESTIAETHWQAMMKVSNRTEAALMAAVKRPVTGAG